MTEIIMLVVPTCQPVKTCLITALLWTRSKSKSLFGKEPPSMTTFPFLLNRTLFLFRTHVSPLRQNMKIRFQKLTRNCFCSWKRKIDLPTSWENTLSEELSVLEKLCPELGFLHSPHWRDFSQLFLCFVTLSTTAFRKKLPSKEKNRDKKRKH